MNTCWKKKKIVSFKNLVVCVIMSQYKVLFKLRNEMWFHQLIFSGCLLISQLTSISVGRCLAAFRVHLPNCHLQILLISSLDWSSAVYWWIREDELLVYPCRALIRHTLICSCGHLQARLHLERKRRLFEICVWVCVCEYVRRWLMQIVALHTEFLKWAIRLYFNQHLM